MVQHRQHLKLASFSPLRAMHLEKGKEDSFPLNYEHFQCPWPRVLPECVSQTWGALNVFHLLTGLRSLNDSTVAELASGKTKVFSNCHSCPMSPNLSPLFSMSKLSVTPVWETETRTSEACLVYQTHLNRPSAHERVLDVVILPLYLPF